MFVKEIMNTKNAPIKYHLPTPFLIEPINRKELM